VDHAEIVSGQGWKVSYLFAADLDLLDLEVDANSGWLVGRKLTRQEARE